MLNYFNPWISQDITISIGGEYDLKKKKVIWRDYSKNKKVRQQEQTISKILSYGALSSPLIIVPLLSLFFHGKRSLPLIDLLGGKSNFWLLTISLGLLVSQAAVYRVYLMFNEGKVCDTKLPIIVQKKIITNDINIRIRHNQGNGGLVNAIFSRIPYLQWLVVTPIFVVFALGAYLAVNDSDSDLSGHLFFYIILVILVATIIGWSQLALPIMFIFLKLEKMFDSEIRHLNIEQLHGELNKAEQFYKNHQVSNAAIKRYLAEYRKILKEKETVGLLQK
ncbi:hypothetical protein FACS1894193_13480 [Bacilli bacterium]|nr:hypothetical protein FACS1894193_13480 [Bacilli bacterium]